MKIREPIIILGSPRSGTTLLGKLIASHPQVAYWEEPRPIWSQGNAWRKNDRLEACDLTPSIARRIDGRFHQFLEQSGRSRFAEKTPSNTLRLPFIHALYPDARIIHLVRDGRAVVGSMMRMLKTPPNRDRMISRLRETPARDLPALLPIFYRDVIVPRLGGGGSKSYWGPRPAGWEDWLDLPVPVMLARQWQTLVTVARNDLRGTIPETQWIEIRYEDLVAAPERSLEDILRVAGLTSESSWLDNAAEQVSSDRAESWRRELEAQAIEQIEEEAGTLLTELNYPVASLSPS